MAYWQSILCPNSSTFLDKSHCIFTMNVKNYDSLVWPHSPYRHRCITLEHNVKIPNDMHSYKARDVYTGIEREVIA